MMFNVILVLVAVFFYLFLNPAFLFASRSSYIEPEGHSHDLARNELSPFLFKRPSDSKLLEFWTLYSPSKNAGRPTTAVVILHSSQTSGYSPCRLNSKAHHEVQASYDLTDITLICPSLPGTGLSAPYAGLTTASEILPLFSRDLTVLVKQRGFSSVAVVGIGKGADPALHLTATLASNKDGEDGHGMEIMGLTAVSPLKWEGKFDGSGTLKKLIVTVLARFFWEPELAATRDYLSSDLFWGKKLRAKMETVLDEVTLAVLEQDAARVLEKYTYPLVYPSKYSKADAQIGTSCYETLNTYPHVVVKILKGKAFDEVDHVKNLKSLPAAVELVLKGSALYTQHAAKKAKAQEGVPPSAPSI